MQATRPKARDKVPVQPLRRTLYRLINHKTFEWFVMGMIVLNVVFNDAPAPLARRVKHNWI